jgi:hypothetical protein
MKEYHKIITVFERDPETKFRTLKDGVFALGEFEYLQNNEWVWTEKVDGTNIRIIFDDGEFVFGGKTDNAQIPSSLANRLNELFFPLKTKFAEIFKDGICLYGEGYGDKIQKGGGNYRPDQHFVLFDVKIGDWWLQRKDIEDVAGKMGIDVVPIIGTGTLHEMVTKTKEGFKSRWGDFIAEGIVARPKIELKARNGQRIITKIKHKDFKN